MIKTLVQIPANTNFKSKATKNKAEDETRILPSNLKSKVEQKTQKVMSAFIDYPVKGLKGDVNANFYEFLTMGSVPYILGSAVFMAVFNLANKTGKKLALGVLMCAALKSVSKSFVTLPVKTFLGIDTELPYQNKVYNLPKRAGEDAEIEPLFQQRKVFDSREFFRKDLLNREYYDKIALRLGLGENLNDSISEVTPIIQNVISTTNTAKSISSSCWAALGVGLAIQDSWLDFFDAIKNRNRYVGNNAKGFGAKAFGKCKNFAKNFCVITKQFFKSFTGAFKQLWKGNSAHGGFKRHSGKALMGLSVLSTIGLTANTIIKAHKMAKNTNLRTIDETKESTVI